MRISGYVITGCDFNLNFMLRVVMAGDNVITGNNQRIHAHFSFGIFYGT